MQSLIRWTIGPVKKSGFDCLIKSVNSFKKLYPEIERYICWNKLSEQQIAILHSIDAKLIDQSKCNQEIIPLGVAWKLYPPRIDINKHELFIDNDLIIEEKIDEIDEFLHSDSTLLLEDRSRNYGKFDKVIAKNYFINSGFFGVPPGFDLEHSIKFYCNNWGVNAPIGHEESVTMDEQGLIAYLLLRYKKCIIIPQVTISGCMHEFIKAKGMHFIGLNRQVYHKPYIMYKNQYIKIHL